MDLKPIITSIFLIIILITQTTYARIIFESEFMLENDGNSWVIDSRDDVTGDITLQFGNTLAKTLTWDNTNIQFSFSDSLKINGDLKVSGGFEDSSGDFGTSGQVLSSTVTGTDWITNTSNPIPFISDSQYPSIPTSTASTITINGYNFIPASTVTVPSFDGTVTSVTPISPTQINATFTPGTNETIYDIVISNNGVLNTLWTGNGEDLLKVNNSDGTTQARSGESCKDIYDNGYSTGDGTYWINPDGGSTSNAFQVYCDMTNGGWTRIEYSADLPHQAQFSGGDADRWLTSNFTLTLTDTQINDIRSVSTEGKQTYHGSCEGVIHYLYQTSNYGYAFGFRFHNGDETTFDQQTYPGTTITVPYDDCRLNDTTVRYTEFAIQDIRVPVINVHSRDNSSTEEFGTPLTSYPAWLR